MSDKSKILQKIAATDVNISLNNNVISFGVMILTYLHVFTYMTYQQGNLPNRLSSH